MWYHFFTYRSRRRKFDESGLWICKWSRFLTIDHMSVCIWVYVCVCVFLYPCVHLYEWCSFTMFGVCVLFVYWIPLRLCVSFICTLWLVVQTLIKIKMNCLYLCNLTLVIGRNNEIKVQNFKYKSSYWRAKTHWYTSIYASSIHMLIMDFRSDIQQFLAVSIACISYICYMQCNILYLLDWILDHNIMLIS